MLPNESKLANSKVHNMEQQRSTKFELFICWWRQKIFTLLWVDTLSAGHLKQFKILIAPFFYVLYYYINYYNFDFFLRRHSTTVQFSVLLLWILYVSLLDGYN